MARRINTWLRLTITQDRFSNLFILHSHSGGTDDLDLKEDANKFLSKCNIKNKKSIFGSFSTNDFV